MPTPGALRKRMADVLNVPHRTIAIFERELRNGDMLSKGGRGRASTQRSPRDAARLLIAMLATESPSRARSALEVYRACRAGQDGESIDVVHGDAVLSARGGAPSNAGANGGLTLAKLCGDRMSSPHTLEDAVAAILDLFGDAAGQQVFQDYRERILFSNKVIDPRVEVAVTNVPIGGYIVVGNELTEYVRADACHDLSHGVGIPTKRSVSLWHLRQIGAFLGGVETPD